MSGFGSRYSFDTCSLIGIDHTAPGPAAAELRWAAFTGPALAWRVQIVEAVFDELAVKPDIVSRHLQPFRDKQMCVPRSEFAYGRLEDNLARVRSDFPQMAKRRQNRERADSLIVAHALTLGGIIVVTDESPVGRQKIPAVCRHYGIECIDLRRFLEMEGLG